MQARRHRVGVLEEALDGPFVALRHHASGLEQDAHAGDEQAAGEPRTTEHGNPPLLLQPDSVAGMPVADDCDAFTRHSHHTRNYYTNTYTPPHTPPTTPPPPPTYPT